MLNAVRQDSDCFTKTIGSSWRKVRAYGNDELTVILSAPLKPPGLRIAALAW